MDLFDSFIHIPFLYAKVTLVLVCIFIAYILFNVGDRYARVPSKAFIYIIGFFVIWWIASRVVVFESYDDRATYARHVMSARWRSFPVFAFDGDFVFQVYVWVCGQFMSYQAWFWLTAAIYVTNYARACFRMVGENAAVMFLLVLVSFGFTSYATNTLRAGLAASFFMLAVTYYHEPKKMLALLLTTIGIHFSMVIPTSMLIISYYLDKTKLFLFVWLAFIALSFVLGSTFESFFASFTAADRASGYLGATSNVYKTGFRWDFLLFSSFPIIAGYYYKYKLNFDARFYNLLLNTYILTNAIWTLVIRVPFTDRFAYLSWFMMPFVFIFPLLRHKITASLDRQIWLIVLLLAGIKTLGYYI